MRIFIPLLFYCKDVLSELAVEAQVLRTEKKYGLSLLDAQLLEHRLRNVLPCDEHDRIGGYLVRSLYFDTPDNADYYDKVDGYEQRRKIRLRIYSPDANTAKLELKQKQGDLQCKRSLSVSREDALRLSKGDYTPLLTLGTPFALEMYALMASKLYRPACLIEYDRTAFAVAANDIRITLDRTLRASESCLSLFDPLPMVYPAALADSTTLEVKYNGFLLSYVKDMLALHSYPQSSISKYCAGRSISMQP